MIDQLSHDMLCGTPRVCRQDCDCLCHETPGYCADHWGVAPCEDADDAEREETPLAQS